DAGGAALQPGVGACLVQIDTAAAVADDREAIPVRRPGHVEDVIAVRAGGHDLLLAAEVPYPCVLPDRATRAEEIPAVRRVGQPKAEVLVLEKLVKQAARVGIP